MSEIWGQFVQVIKGDFFSELQTVYFNFTVETQAQVPGSRQASGLCSGSKCQKNSTLLGRVRHRRSISEGLSPEGW